MSLSLLATTTATTASARVVLPTVWLSSSEKSHNHQSKLTRYYSSGCCREEGQAHHQRPRQDLLRHQGLFRQHCPPSLLLRVRFPNCPRPRCCPRDHCSQGWYPRHRDQEEPQACKCDLHIPSLMATDTNRRIPRSGPPASCLSARSTLPSPSPTCLSKE